MKKIKLVTLSLFMGLAYGIPTLQELAARAALQLPTTPEAIETTLSQSQKIDTGKAKDWLDLLPEDTSRIFSDSLNRLLQELPPIIQARLIKKATQEEMHILRLAYNPDGSRIAASIGPATPNQLFNAETGEWICTLDEQSIFEYQMTYNPDGLQVASHRANLIRICDSTTGITLKRLDLDGGYIAEITYSADGRYIMAGLRNGLIKIWDTHRANTSEGFVYTIHGHTDIISSVDYHPNGRNFMTASHDRTIKVWDAASRGCIKTIELSDPFVSSARYNSDGSQIVAAGMFNISIIDSLSGKCLRIIAEDDHVNAAIYTPDDARIVSATSSIIRIWDAATGNQLQKYERYPHYRYPHPNHAIACNPNGTQLAIAAGDTLLIHTLGSTTGRIRLSDYFAIKFLTQNEDAPIAQITQIINTAGPEARSCLIALLARRTSTSATP